MGRQVVSRRNLVRYRLLAVPGHAVGEPAEVLFALGVGVPVFGVLDLEPLVSQEPDGARLEIGHGDAVTR